MQQTDETIVDVCFGATCDFSNGPGYDPVGDLTDQDKNQCDGQRLQIDVWADELGQALYLFDYIIQRELMIRLVIGIVFIFISFRHAESTNIACIAFHTAWRRD